MENYGLAKGSYIYLTKTKSESVKDYSWNSTYSWYGDKPLKAQVICETDRLIMVTILPRTARYDMRRTMSTPYIMTIDKWDIEHRKILVAGLPVREELKDSVPEPA